MGLTVVMHRKPAATAEPITHVIEASAAAHGTISPNGQVAVNHGADQEFTFGADSGYHVVSVTVDGEPVSTVSPYTFHGVSAAHTIAVAVAINEPVRTVLVESFDALGNSAAVAAAAGDLLVLHLLADIGQTDVGFRVAVAWGSQSFAQGAEATISEGLGWICTLSLVVSEANAGSHAVVPDWSDGDTPGRAIGSLERWLGTVAASPVDQSAADENEVLEPGTADPDSGVTAATAQAHEIAVCAVGWLAVPASAGAWDSGYTAGVSVGSGLHLTTAYRILTAIGTARARRTGASTSYWGALCTTYKVSA